MAERIITTHGLLQALKAEDYSLPEGCTEVRLVMGVNAGFLLQFDVYVNQRNLAKLGRALQRLAEEEPVA